MQPSVANKLAECATVGCYLQSHLYCRALKPRGAFEERGRRWRAIATPVAALALIVALLLPAAAAEAESEGEFANPGSIEGTATKAGGARIAGIEVCAFDVAEDEEFTECAETKANGIYEIDGLDEGPYRVEFKRGTSGLDYLPQFWKGATSASKATIVRAEEGRSSTGIDAEMKLPPGATSNGTGIEIGDTCEYDSFDEEEGWNFEISREGAGLPTTSPIAGVLTKWMVNASGTAYLPGHTMEMRVVVPFENAKVGVGTQETRALEHPGVNEFKTSYFPIGKGDNLALTTNDQSTGPACSKPAAGHKVKSGHLEDPIREAEEMGYGIGEVAVPVAGVVEPDEDGDRLGDDTQDGCPQSAAFHGPCPTVAFAPTYTVGARWIKVKVRASAKTPIAVTGASPGPGILAGPSRTTRAGVGATVSLPITNGIIARLRHLGPHRSLRVRLRAHASKVAGPPSTDILQVRLPGRGRRARP
jgi:hypothetical protein